MYVTFSLNLVSDLVKQMGDEKQSDDTQSDLSNATESLKIDGDQKENGDSKSDKVKGNNYYNALFLM